MQKVWVPAGGIAGALAVICGLLCVDKVGAAVFGGLTITANILNSSRTCRPLQHCNAKRPRPGWATT